MRGKEKQKTILMLFKLGKYACTETGQIISFFKSKKGKILKSHVSKTGYNTFTPVDLSGKAFICFVHQFVYLYFKGEYPEQYQINHINGNKSDNMLNNLEAISASQNQKHSFRIGLASAIKGQNSTSALLTDREVKSIRSKTRLGVKQRDLAKKFGVSNSTINNIVKRRSWRHL